MLLFLSLVAVSVVAQDAITFCNPPNFHGLDVQKFQLSLLSDDDLVTAYTGNLTTGVLVQDDFQEASALVYVEVRKPHDSAVHNRSVTSIFGALHPNGAWKAPGFGVYGLQFPGNLPGLNDADAAAELEKRLAPPGFAYRGYEADSIIERKYLNIPRPTYPAPCGSGKGKPTNEGELLWKELTADDELALSNAKHARQLPKKVCFTAQDSSGADVSPQFKIDKVYISQEFGLAVKYFQIESVPKSADDPTYSAYGLWTRFTNVTTLTGYFPPNSNKQSGLGLSDVNVMLTAQGDITHQQADMARVFVGSPKSADQSYNGDAYLGVTLC